MRTRPPLAWLGVALLLGTAAACRSAPHQSPYAPPTEAARNTTKAEKLTREAADLIDTDPGTAEATLREALTADIFHGPAHNNLGVLFLKQEKLYEAAQEFEWAKKLLPGHPDPKINLALVLERAGRIDEALASYGEALDAYPDYLPAIQGAARLIVASQREDERLQHWLGDIALRGDTEVWREWARARSTARP